ncbi:hypothetical protein [Streptosporangium sandarakinum]|uniref:Uncharacterized protein n=1 Tax=Streptosporangium sandarakinum TaxID=1260955 RepID=A0A852UR42_9ACTN|nr:hypothetical protein [Streptosporangium sandarakinum]NYF38098.1 hypothetical protein [Streptosporangium sandarakinum]
MRVIRRIRMAATVLAVPFLLAMTSDVAEAGIRIANHCEPSLAED